MIRVMGPAMFAGLDRAQKLNRYERRVVIGEREVLPSFYAYI